MRTFEARLEPFSPSFVQEEKIPSPAQRFVEGFSGWSRPLRPFLLDNAGWFVGAYSGPNRPLIPIESGHLFRGNPAGDSGAK